MDTSEKVFKLSGKNLDLDSFRKKIFESGTTFSGSITYNNSENSDTRSLMVFDFVNKANIDYILDDISKDQEVILEIFAHASNPKKLQ